ncbi:PREDICTED: tRNA (cytosine(38)-C(5))-methyltransferase [Dufourea novaeangliae]|uniref:tRNA (cytosine(38)-C(5))-methyltransferase n=1 Tax=Dufourea novaeangliae TaxID=178035 RepID=A0A154PPB3_DUFNO|nr:PREDICTED: tRNA (cytosine(38)-C(5))-methyltransferase [Dufourea novaeangliae]KZC13735.1 tRNA (cytosine(38)-C(5))-methyltransferase [Dufourea novaeangliae]
MMRVLELYSGIGGMHYALQESGVSGNCVAAIDINNVANAVYKYNFPNVYLINRNIQSLSAQEINNINIDTILMSPPCQPYTRVGLQKDISDNRSSSLFHVLKLIPQIKVLKYILLENVKGFEKSEMRNAVLKCINDSGFDYRELILSPCQFGVPNSRHRYYLLAKKRNLRFCFDNVRLNFNLPENVLTALPKSKHNLLVDKNCTQDTETNKKCYTLDNILETVEETQYLVPRKLLQKRAWLLDIRTSQSHGSCCFTKAYGHYVEGTGSVYCPYSEETIKETYLAARNCNRESLEVSEYLGKLRLRYFTPREVCRLMCFPEDFTFPEHLTCKQKYRLLGNSINVHVVSRLIFLLCTEE